MYLYIQNYFYYNFIINICVHVHSNRDEKGEMFIIFSGHAQASDPDPEIAAKHGQDARQWEYQGVSFPLVAFYNVNEISWDDSLWMKYIWVPISWPVQLEDNINFASSKYIN